MSDGIAAIRGIDMSRKMCLDLDHACQSVRSRHMQIDPDDLIAVATGKESKSEAQGIGDEEFCPWTYGPVT